MTKIPKPKKHHQKKLFQCRIDPELLSKAAKKKLKDGFSWSELIEHYLKYYLEG